MGTLVDIKARGSDAAATQAAINAAFDEIARLENLMSHWRDDSQVARINAEAGKAPVAVAPEVFEVIERALGASRMTGGAFDITVASVGALWRIDGEDPRVPAKEAVRRALTNVGWRHVRLDEKARTVFLDAAGVRIGLGGIAKGYAVDRAMNVLRSHGVRSAIITAGGDSALLGSDGDHPWRIGIRHPRVPGRTIASFDADDTTVHTSGDYERFIVVKGKRYCHILDPETGRPASRARSVSVVTKDGTLGDALSTGIFVMGPGQGLRLAESLAGVDALIVDSRGKVTMTSGMHKRARLTP
jgi:thiamine biosynthesis lipoprotein